MLSTFPTPRDGETLPCLTREPGHATLEAPLCRRGGGARAVRSALRPSPPRRGPPAARTAETLLPEAPRSAGPAAPRARRGKSAPCRLRTPPAAPALRVQAARSPAVEGAAGTVTAAPTRPGPGRGAEADRALGGRAPRPAVGQLRGAVRGGPGPGRQRGLAHSRGPGRPSARRLRCQAGRRISGPPCSAASGRAVQPSGSGAGSFGAQEPGSDSYIRGLLPRSPRGMSPRTPPPAHGPGGSSCCPRPGKAPAVTILQHTNVSSQCVVHLTQHSILCQSYLKKITLSCHTYWSPGEPVAPSPDPPD